jgi:hypothetical protein
MMKKKYLLYATLILLICGFYYGYQMYNKPLQSIENKNADVALTAVDLLKDFNNNEHEANTKYLDKIIAVSGKVTQIQNNNIYLSTDNEMSNIICEMEDVTNLSAISKDEMIVVKGVCTGYLMDVILVRCTIIN